MAAIKHTVVWGDTLSAIALKYNTTVNAIAQLNNIKNVNIIVVGQVLLIKDDETNPTPKPVTKTTVASRAVVTIFGLQSDTTRTMYAYWPWAVPNTEHYEIMWHYSTGDGIWFIGNDSTTKDTQSIYTAPENAISVKFKVKPVSTKRAVNKVETAYWTTSWSTENVYHFANNPPSKPGVPEVEIVNYTLTASLDNLNVNGTNIEFQIVKDDSTIFNTGTAIIKTSSASYQTGVNAGGEYKVRARSVRGKLYSDWSDYSANKSTIPSAPTAITKIRGTSETAIYLEWSSVTTATSYELEYATKITSFDNTGDTQKVSAIENNRYEKTGLTSGNEYFFRVRAINTQGTSGWSPIKSVKIGEKPGAPTTWSSTTTGISGTPINLYWVHNSIDGSNQSYAELELYINGVKQVKTIENTNDDEVTTSSYTLPTTQYTQGSVILWRVRTAGITLQYGAWSIQRTIDIYAPPTLTLSVKDSNDAAISTLKSFPFYIRAVAGPSTQAPIGYHVSIISNDKYETVDQVGNVKMVNVGEAVYSKHFNTKTVLAVVMSANNIDLENNMDYTVEVVVSMNSGLTATAKYPFKVSWTDTLVEPNAEIGFDPDTITTHIRPYCVDDNNALISGITLSVYRREFDGGFTELAKGIKNLKKTFIKDPHPALDYARYRIVAINDSTGAVSYYDVQGYPIQEKAVIIQWAEQWSNFDIDRDEVLEEPAWSGSLLRLPYNVDVSEDHSNDVELINYIGRKRPVSYYGTQLGETATWNVEIVADDKETLYGLRRLAVWMGDVYVREPSGSGYWATISVSISQRHNNLTIPVTLTIERTEGGV